MPTNLTDVSTWNATVQVPTDGDPVAAGSGSYLRTTLQTFADRTKYLYDILVTNGITKVRKVTSTTNLKAITSPVEGDIAILAAGGIPQVYAYRAGTLAGTDLSGMRYDSTAAVGYWVSSWFYLVSLSSGSPQLDVQTLPPPNRIVSVTESGETSGSTNATTLGGVFGPSLSVAVETGDKVLIEGHCTFAPNGADASGYVYIAVDGVTQPYSRRNWDCANPGNMPLTPSVLYTATGASTLTIRLYQIMDTFVSGTPILTAHRSVRATVIRPLRRRRAAKNAAAHARVLRDEAAIGLARLVVAALLYLHLALGLVEALGPRFRRQEVRIERLAIAGADALPGGLQFALEPRFAHRALHEAAAPVGRLATLVRGTRLLRGQRHARAATLAGVRLPASTGRGAACAAGLAAVAGAVAGPVRGAYLPARTGTGPDTGHGLARGARYGGASASAGACPCHGPSRAGLSRHWAG